MNKPIKPDLTFGEWFRMLKKMAINSYGFEVSDNSADAWQEYYEDYFTPREALDEDTYAGI